MKNNRVVMERETPLVTSFPAMANILSLLGTNKSMQAWICDHFIQILMRPDHPYSMPDFYDQADLDNFFCIVFSSPGLSWMRNNRETAKWTYFTDYIEEQLREGYCVEACLDRYYFDFWRKRGGDHFIHSTLIYGYDNQKKEIYAADFWEDFKYGDKTLSYDEINRSINNNGIINLYKIYKDEEYDFNPELMKLYLRDYINSEDSMRRFEFSGRDYNKNALFGLDYYDAYINYAMHTNWVDVRGLHVLCDHKALMKNRINYISENGLCSKENAIRLIDMNQKLMNTSLVIRSMGIKYNIRPSEELKERIVNQLNQLKIEDKKFTVELLESCS